MQQKAFDIIPNKFCTGDFRCRVLDRTNNVIQIIEEHNLVVNTAKTILATLLGGTGHPVSLIGFGTGTAAANVADTGLLTPEYYGITGVMYPAGGTSVQFNWYLAYDQLVGVNISEFGLFTEDYDMFSKKTYSAIPKSADMAFDGQWTITFFQES